jgi:SAM-dependent methyltransferase
MVGSDATPNFVKVSKETGIYTDVFEHWFGTGLENFPAEHKSRYDLVTASGCLSKGHIPKEGLDDIHAALKVGGYFVAGWRTFYLTPGEENGFYEKLESMTSLGQFTLVNRYDFQRGLTGKHLDPDVKKEFEKGIARFASASSTITVYQKSA